MISRKNRASDKTGTIVLNARRHRDGDATRRTRRNWRPHENVLNARRHRDGDQTSTSRRIRARASGCSTPEGIETVISERAGGRHRLRFECSTPEGVETGDQAANASLVTFQLKCSTPEGIETVIRRFGGLLVDAAHRYRCSTPEGIETVIRLSSSRRLPYDSGVLNARRHRDGDQRLLRDGPQAPASVVVLNARRHRDGDQDNAPNHGLAMRLQVDGAQRPKASRR